MTPDLNLLLFLAVVALAVVIETSPKIRPVGEAAERPGGRPKAEPRDSRVTNSEAITRR